MGGWGKGLRKWMRGLLGGHGTRSWAVRGALLLALALVVGGVAGLLSGVVAGGSAHSSGPAGPPPPGSLSAEFAGRSGSAAGSGIAQGAPTKAPTRAALETAAGVPLSQSEAPRRARAPRRKGARGHTRQGGVTLSASAAGAPSPAGGASLPGAPGQQVKLSKGPHTEAKGYRNRPPVPGISDTPSKTEPYWACPHGLCEAIIVPRPQKKVNGHWASAAGGRAYEGSGEFGAYSPKDLESAYNVFAAAGGHEDKAAEEKQTIALIDEGPYPNAEKDLNEYRETYGLPPCTKASGCFRHINEQGEEGNYAPEEFGVETPLDLDMASAGCPNCHILLVSSNSDFMSDLGASAKKAAEEGANETSSSFGAAEQELGPEEISELDHDYHFKEGVVNYAASGDGGYQGVYYGQESLWTPAAETNVISVGATALRRADNARGWSESSWFAAGSGCSRVEEKPAWQLNSACPHRADNDVTAVGAGETPVSVRFNGEWWLVAGTSAASPLVAGIEAHASPFAHALPGADGFYSDPAAFNDVTEGSTAPNGECAAAILCTAGPGWDGPTGVGSPNGPMTITSLTPLLETGIPSAVTETAGTLKGALDPQGTPTSYYFQYGTSANYGSSTATTSAGSGSAHVEASAGLSGLQPRTTYHYRLVAVSAHKAYYGRDVVFRTAGPTLTHVTPDAGPPSGGTSVTISGTNFAGVTEVKFGAKRAGFRVVSETTITATATPGSGTVDVTVVTPAGATATGPSDRFNYEHLLWQRQQLTPPDEGPWNLSLNGVSCASSEWCMAVGMHQSEYGPFSFLPDAQVVDRGHWTVQHSASPGGIAAYPSEPLGTAVDSQGDVWVTDAGHNRVEEFSPTGVFMLALGWGVKDGKAEAETCTETCQPGIAGSGPGQFNLPWGIAVAPNGDVWVVDSENARVEQFTAAGKYIRQVTSSGMTGGQFTVKRMAIDQSGNLWVSEPGSGQVQELSEAGTVLLTITSLNVPTGIAIDGSGNIWVAEESDERLDEYSATGAFIRTTGWGVKDGKSEAETCTEGCQPGIAGTGNGQFDKPKGVAIDEKETSGSSMT